MSAAGVTGRPTAEGGGEHQVEEEGAAEGDGDEHPGDHLRGVGAQDEWGRPDLTAGELPGADGHQPSHDDYRKDRAPPSAGRVAGPCES